MNDNSLDAKQLRNLRSDSDIKLEHLEQNVTAAVPSREAFSQLSPEGQTKAVESTHEMARFVDKIRTVQQERAAAGSDTPKGGLTR